MSVPFEFVRASHISKLIEFPYFLICSGLTKNSISFPAFSNAHAYCVDITPRPNTERDRYYG